MIRKTRFATKRVLVVEDDPSQRRLVQEILGPLVTTQVVGSVDDALALLHGDGHFDLVVTDYRLPGRNGADLIAALRSDPRHQGLPILVVTATDNATDLARLKALGATGVLIKPYEPLLLSALVLLGVARGMGAIG